MVYVLIKVAVTQVYILGKKKKKKKSLDCILETGEFLL